LHIDYCRLKKHLSNVNEPWGRGYLLTLLKTYLSQRAQSHRDCYCFGWDEGRFAKVSFEIARGRHGSAPSVTSTDIA